MRNVCTVYPYIQNKEGKMVVSNLFQDLMNLTKDRNITKNIYKDSYDEKLLKEKAHLIEYDDLGELTLKSALAISDINIEEEKLLEFLNNKHRNKNIEYNTAVAKLLDFNNNSEYKTDYMATIVLNESSKYDLVIVPKTDVAIDQLYNEVLNSSLQNRIIYRLAEAGVSVEFLEKAPYNGRYSTKNATKTAEGLYALISILKGEKIDPVLAEETGHFLLGALKDNPLAKRLEALMTDEVQRQVLGDQYTEKVLGNNPARETAGVLIGEALLNNETNIPTTGIRNVINRIIDFFKKTFATITRDTVTIDIMEAKQIASSIAEDFLYRDFTGTVENALDTIETLFDKELTEVDKILNGVTLNLRRLKEETKNANSKIAKAAEDLYDFAEQARTLDLGLFNNNFSIQNMIALLLKMEHLCSYDVAMQLSKVKTKKGNVKDIVSNAYQLREVRQYLNTFMGVLNLISRGIDNRNIKVTDADMSIRMTNARGEEIRVNLNQVIRQATSIANDLLITLQKKENIHFLNFLASIYGDYYVERAARVVLTGKRVKGEIPVDPEQLKKVGPIRRYLLTHIKRVKDQKIPIEDMMKYLDRDCTFLDQWLWSNNKNTDIIISIADKGIRDAGRFASQLTQKDLEKILELEKEYNKLRNDKKVSPMSAYYERYELREDLSDDYTSNYIDKRNWGEWSRDYKEWKAEMQELFLKEFPDAAQDSDIVKGAKFEAWFKPLRKEWNKQHSEWIEDPRNPLEVILAPKLSLYKNHNYDLLTEEDKVFLEKIKTLKMSIDSKLYRAGVLHYRAPQFKGTFINLVRNNMNDFSAIKSVGKAFYTKIHDTFCHSCTDEDFGSEFTYNSESDMLYKNAIQFESDQINRLQLYGIRSLSNPKEMSTDIFGSLLAYSNMANNYFATQQIVDSLEVGKEVLLLRQDQSYTPENKRNSKDHTRAFNTYCKLLDNKVYKNNNGTFKTPLKVISRKTGRFLGRLGSTIYMGGNVSGAIVSAGTGTIEMFKEAISGEFYDLKDFTKGALEYCKYATQNIAEIGRQIKTNKVDLYIRHFDADSRNANIFQNYHSQKHRVAEFVMNSLYLPYAIGEHYMSAVPFISIGLKTILYKATKNSAGDIVIEKTNLWDAYTVNKDKTNIEVIGDLLKDKKNIEEYKMLQSIIKKVSKYSTSKILIDKTEAIEKQKKHNEKVKEDRKKGIYDNDFDNTSIVDINDLGITQEELEYLKTYNFETDITSIINDLYEKRDSFLWDTSPGSADEANYQNICREISNKMHGIYNFIDKSNFQHTLLGEIMFTMRGYFLGMMDRRFLNDRFNVSTKKDDSGNIIDNLIVVLDGLTSLEAFNTALLATFSPIIAGSYVKKRMMNAGYSEHQYKNMRRFNMDYTFILLLYLIKTLTAQSENIDDDDDEEDNLLLGIAYYLSSRWLREQIAFNSVKGIRDEISTFGNFDPVALSIVGDMLSITSGLIGQQFVQSYDFKIPYDEMQKNYTKYYYNRKSTHYTYGDSKAILKLKKFIPYYRLKYTFSSPYEAAASFDYAKKLKR